MKNLPELQPPIWKRYTPLIRYHSARTGMSYLTEVSLEDQFGSLEVFQTGLGFVPNLIRAQSLLPRLIDAQSIKERSILQDASLSRLQKQQILLRIAASREDP